MKMKLGNILLGASMIIATVTFAQDGDGNNECKRMRFIANKAMAAQDYKEAVEYFLKAEVICGPDFMKNDKGEDIGSANYDRLTGSIIREIQAGTNLDIQKLYGDTLDSVYTRMDKINLYDKKNDMMRGSYLLKKSVPDYVQADFYFTRGINTHVNGGNAVHESYIPVAYYNTYTLFFMEQDEEKKAALKKRMISDYFDLSKLVTKANFSIGTQESITQYFNTVVQTCDDLTPEISDFITGLTEDVDAAKLSLMNLIDLMETKKCTDTKEYMDLINAYLEIDPSSPKALEMKAKGLEKETKYREANVIYEKLILLEEVTQERKDALKYKIVWNIFNTRSYKAAYNKAMSTSGASRGKSLIIAAQCVARMANDCGTSTFERKCNYIYAVRLLERSGVASATMIAKYKANFPTSRECFAESNPTSVTLSCWGVSVSPCK
ncbi:MAG: hypothetical protein HRT57_00785 [Crocinitomicaceae bacterium]|nr:hypothetical protein [Crocinitomicaceae bacterium]